MAVAPSILPMALLRQTVVFLLSCAAICTRMLVRMVHVLHTRVYALLTTRVLLVLLFARLT